jgi:hypothetical protein
MMEYLYKFFVRGADPQSEFLNFSQSCLIDLSIENNVQHLPDLMRFRSLVDVLALCNFCVLANVLDYNTYQFPLSKGGKPSPREIYLRNRYDYNVLSPVKRCYYSYMCGVAFNFMKWLISEFDIVSTKENPEELSISELLSEYLDDQTYAILNYKQKAEMQQINGIVNCKAVDVKRQLDLLFDGNESLTNCSSDDEKDLLEYDTFLSATILGVWLERPRPR